MTTEVPIHVLRQPEVEERAVRLARVLRGRFGVRPGDRVAVLSGGRPEVFELLYACGYAGAAMVPLNVRLADSELREILGDCRPLLVAANPDQAERVRRLAAPQAPVYRFGEEHRAALDAAMPLSRTPASPADELPALILYTSGTTGRPKGAVLPWRQLRFNARMTAALLDLGPRDRTLACLPLFHTGGLNCLAIPTLSAGGEVILMERFEPERAVEALERFGVSATIAVPAMYRMLLDAGLGRCPAPSLRHLLVGGAPLPDELRARYRELGRPLAQGYGLTEVGPNCFTFGAADVGGPVPGTEARLEAEGREAEPGEVGELLLRGPHVCAGYWQRPEESERARREGGWFRTGDLMRRDARGRYYVVGRKKEMFISGGENVYPAEVERVLGEHPAIAEISVVGVPDPAWGEIGAAALVLEKGRAVDAGSLRAWARERLAGYKVPRHWRVFAELPRNSTGKVQKSEIAASFAAEREAS